MVNLKENIDYNCEFLGTIDKDENLIGTAGVNFMKCILPRFEHIIVHPKYQKTGLAVRLMHKTEEMIKNKGFNEYLSFIFRDNLLMIKYARKFGFEFYEKGNIGDWYKKSIKERQNALVTV